VFKLLVVIRDPGFRAYTICHRSLYYILLQHLANTSEPHLASIGYDRRLFNTDSKA